jgi:hypothetical protein
MRRRFTVKTPLAFRLVMKKQNKVQGIINVNVINDNNPTPATAVMPSKSTLDSAPGRAFAFLRTVGNDPKVAAALHGCGYTSEDHEEGWRLVHALAGFKEPAGIPESPRVLAEHELQRWVVTGLRRARVALEHKNPAEAAFVFDGLVDTRGPEAVLTVSVFLDRLDALDGGAERKGTRKADHAALATLARRGIDEAERKRLRAYVDTVQAANDGVVEQPASDRTTKLLALHAWVQDWSETARTVITNRTMLIRLGAAKRRKSGAAPIVTPVVTPVVTPPSPAPTPVVVVTPVVTQPSAPQLPAAPAATDGSTANDVAKQIA